MGKIRIWSGGHTTSGRRVKSKRYIFEVLLLPVYDDSHRPASPARKGNGHRARLKNPLPRPSGYQATVPALPGLVTFGRTLEEAREMAQDALRVYLEGMRKAGEPIPDESDAVKETLSVALAG